jgi:hypothetical protein
MFISYSELVGMLIGATISAGMLILLFSANYMLLKENRYLKGRLRAWRRQCAKRHTEVPF